MEVDGRSQKELALRLLSTSISCCVADAACLPMDTLKVRLQLQNELLPSSTPRLSPIGMARQMIQTEGFSSFYAGLSPAMLRQASYGGLSFFSYPFIRDEMYKMSGQKRIEHQLLAGALAGGASAAFANPTDVLKVRMQSDGRRLLQGKPRLYPASTIGVLIMTIRQGGIAQLYSGLGPNVSRAAVVNGVGIASYDVSKSFIANTFGEGPLAQRLGAALVGGAATALAGCPFDVLKTRLMAQSASGDALYSSAFDCLFATVRTEGFFALWKGLFPVYCRQAPFNLGNYLIMEALLDILVRDPSPPR
mmetsp:Transcript_2146/g.3333  ORF Transcript_2146/g.3333 Transcript_2146/m.3333 type:complete len:306 (-) Transcript_2146:2086-3003(-)